MPSDGLLMMFAMLDKRTASSSRPRSLADVARLRYCACSVVPNCVKWYTRSMMSFRRGAEQGVVTSRRRDSVVRSPCGSVPQLIRALASSVRFIDKCQLPDNSHHLLNHTPLALLELLPTVPVRPMVRMAAPRGVLA